MFWAGWEGAMGETVIVAPAEISLLVWAMSGPADHDAYIAEAADHLRPVLMRIRAQLSAALPDAREIIKYNMPGFAMGDTIIVGYAAFSKQCGLYMSAASLQTEADAISTAGLKASKTGITFAPSKAPDDALVARLARAALRANGL